MTEKSSVLQKCGWSEQVATLTWRKILCSQKIRTKWNGSKGLISLLRECMLKKVLSGARSKVAMTLIVEESACLRDISLLLDNLIFLRRFGISSSNDNNCYLPTLCQGCRGLEHDWHNLCSCQWTTCYCLSC